MAHRKGAILGASRHRSGVLDRAIDRIVGSAAPSGGNDAQIGRVAPASRRHRRGRLRRVHDDQVVPAPGVPVGSQGVRGCRRNGGARRARAADDRDVRARHPLRQRRLQPVHRHLRGKGSLAHDRPPGCDVDGLCRPHRRPGAGVLRSPRPGRPLRRRRGLPDSQGRRREADPRLRRCPPAAVGGDSVAGAVGQQRGRGRDERPGRRQHLGLLRGGRQDQRVHRLQPLRRTVRGAPQHHRDRASRDDPDGLPGRRRHRAGIRPTSSPSATPIAT